MSPSGDFACGAHATEPAIVSWNTASGKLCKILNLAYEPVPYFPQDLPITGMDWHPTRVVLLAVSNGFVAVCSLVKRLCATNAKFLAFRRKPRRGTRFNPASKRSRMM